MYEIHFFELPEPPQLLSFETGKLSFPVEKRGFRNARFAADLGDRSADFILLERENDLLFGEL